MARGQTHLRGHATGCPRTWVVPWLRVLASASGSWETRGTSSQNRPGPSEEHPALAPRDARRLPWFCGPEFQVLVFQVKVVSTGLAVHLILTNPGERDRTTTRALGTVPSSPPGPAVKSLGPRPRAPESSCALQDVMRPPQQTGDLHTGAQGRQGWLLSPRTARLSSLERKPMISHFKG